MVKDTMPVKGKRYASTESYQTGEHTYAHIVMYGKAVLGIIIERPDRVAVVSPHGG